MRTRAIADRSASIERGEASNKLAGSRGITIVDARGRVIHPVVRLRVPWAEDLTEDEAQIGSEVGTGFTNASGDGLSVGDVVVIDGDTVVTTTTPQDTRTIGVIILGGENGSEVVVQTSGVVELVHVAAAVTANNYAETSAAAGQATENATPRAGSFGRYLTSGTTPRALLFGQTYLSGGGSGGGGVPSWYNVRDYGAIGDGTTDDTTAIQDAIDAACAAAGGVVYLPLATYLISAALTVTCDFITLLGDGPQASVIKAAAGLATGNMLELTSADYCSVRALGLTSASQKTGGVGVLISSCFSTSVERMWIHHQYDAIKSNGSTIVRLVDLDVRDTKRHGIWLTGAGNDYYLSRIVADNTPTATGNGIQVDSGVQAIIGENCDFIHFTNGLAMAPSATSTWHFFTGMIFDTNSNDGIHLGDGAAALRGVTFVNCWAASNGATGVYIGVNVEGVQFTGGKVLNNGQNGFLLDTGATRVTIADNLIVSNSQSSSGTHSGIRVVPAITHLTITGNHAWNGWGLGSTQKYGLTFDAGATDYLALDANDFSGNTTGDINGLSGVTGTHKFIGGQAGMTGAAATTYLDGTGNYSTPTGTGAPTAADYLVGTAQAGLSAEIVVGTTPGGELGGTWPSPTVDPTHSGSAHHDPVTVGTGLDVTGQLVELDLSEVAAGGELGGSMDAPTVDASHSGSSHAATQAAAEATAAAALATALLAITPDHEHIHNLWFSGDGATTAFELPAAPFDANAVAAYVAGVRLAVTLSGAMLTTMTFGAAPASGTDNIVVDLIAAAA